MGLLYERVASNLEGAISKGVYPIDSRLPSIRKTSEREQVSIATVIEAFARLEERGLIEARPKSGYFVRGQAAADGVPGVSRPPKRPNAVAVASLALEFCVVERLSGMVSLGTALPSSETLGIEAFARVFARAVRIHQGQTGKYEATEGAAPLRRVIAHMLADNGALMREDEVVITNGCQEALSLALKATTRPGDVVAVESPTYFGVLQALEGAGLRVLELPTSPRHGVDLDALERVAERGQVRACILAPNFQNPLGFKMSDAAKERAVEILARHQVPLIEDDVYGVLGIGNRRPRTAQSFDISGNTIQCGSFSKTVSPAIRLGWMVPGRHIDEVLRHKFLANISTAKIAQLAMAEYLSGNKFRKTTQAAARTYARRCELLRRTVLRHFPEGTRVTAPAGGFVLWVEMPRGYDGMELFERAREIGITFFPGRIFTASNSYATCLRLSVGAIKEDDIPDLMERLGGLARQIGPNG